MGKHACAETHWTVRENGETLRATRSPRAKTQLLRARAAHVRGPSRAQRARDAAAHPSFMSFPAGAR
jgi:hypothetical protein